MEHIYSKRLMRYCLIIGSFGGPTDVSVPQLLWHRPSFTLIILIIFGLVYFSKSKLRTHILHLLVSFLSGQSQ